MGRILGFPDTVDERAARTVAAGVVTIGATALATDQLWLAVPLAAGFAARVATGPRLSPLGLLATKVIVPRLSGPPRPVSGAPKRLAQAMGLTLSITAVVLGPVLGRRRAARAVLGMLVGAAGLEAAAGICLACRLYPVLVRAGLVPEASCSECADISDRLAPVPSTAAAGDLIEP
jgi:hypothetical protein